MRSTIAYALILDVAANIFQEYLLIDIFAISPFRFALRAWH
jgi:hypothetical protein